MGVSMNFALRFPINVPLIALQSTTLFFFPQETCISADAG